MKENKCETLYCRNEWYLTYLGKKICLKCWSLVAIDTEIKEVVKNESKLMINNKKECDDDDANR